ncbi:hemerythrin domain-containing protein [Ferrimonas aestuarii]|uniref:Hemerythrin n=1 Tax=Ferrimonas aestuarii TaxID=2569539 RepID=A0A4U1BFT9_9GAMM|nr:hemerythrin domain-containing protein [Ferrimonas aestuarii]TKB50181.1 hemerythrin [Ferrimonas aestuarii]
MLARIRTDHRHILTLLNLLHQKIERLQAGQEVNLTLLRDVIYYLLRYADCSHHPLEDILYRYYLEKMGSSDQVSQLEVEHQSLRRATENLLDTLNTILNDVVVPRERLIQGIQEFVSMQTRHLTYEEQHILPLMEAEFTDEDWQQLDQQVASKLMDDPLFGRGGDQDFEDLRSYLVDAE